MSSPALKGQVVDFVSSIKELNVIVLDKSPWCIFCLLTCHELSLIIGSVYFKPSLDFILETFQVSLSDICEKYSDSPILIGGGFNCRVAELDEIPEDMLVNTELFECRLSNDKILNARGRNILEFMSLNSIALLNGRTSKDRPAQFTHFSNSGNSVIYLAWINNSFLSFIKKNR
ncbi:hypothetical protein JTB14_007008 [Gonioctena quinquepunctata]|nr:hypothetical protein JTB14_007008 [Gonioctena quinquepunctata]